MTLIAQAVVAGILLLAALVFSMLGQGGGAIYTPVQVLAGVDFHVAATTSLFLIMVLSVSSSLVFHKAGKIDWPLAGVLESTTAVGGFAGGWWSAPFSGPALSVLFAIVIGSAALFMVRTVVREPDCPAEARGLMSWPRTLGGQRYCVNLALALPVTFVAGLLSGLVGVGGGILNIPIMVLLLGIPMDIAVGCSAFMVGLTAAGGFAGHVVHGHWDWRASLVFAVLVFIGAQLGSRMALKADKKKLKHAFGWFLLALAAVMIGRAVG